jgi:hypothetical protein
MNLRRVQVLDIKKIYLDRLQEWVEVPVFDQGEIIKAVNDIDWDGLDMRQYKKLLVEHWPGLSPSVKTKLKNPVARDELYEVLIHENWGLRPGSTMGSYYNKIESDNVLAWFASNKLQGRAPDVLG